MEKSGRHVDPDRRLSRDRRIETERFMKAHR